MPVSQAIRSTRSILSTLPRALRVYQWVKNSLVFIPLLMAHRVLEADLLIQAVYAFFALSLCASGTYVINDLADIESDRVHPTKRNRPFAAGALSLRFGMVLAPVLVLLAFGLSLLTLPVFFTILLAVYVATTVAYSFALKREPIVDVLTLAGLYTLRVLAGAAATGVLVSEWLLAFSLFFFFSLALVKRYAELRLLEKHPEPWSNRRGYQIDDLTLMRGLGPASGYMAVLVLALYITSAEVGELYPRAELLWLISPLLLYWTTRIWLLAHRGQMNDEPILFTVRDRTSYVVGALIALVGAAASL
jgi:4-hydroxybenzoate polyprenyltransferase